MKDWRLVKVFCRNPFCGKKHRCFDSEFKTNTHNYNREILANCFLDKRTENMLHKKANTSLK